MMAADGFDAAAGVGISPKREPAPSGPGYNRITGRRHANRWKSGWRRRIVRRRGASRRPGRFCQALTDSGTRFFGAAWCPHCTDQRQLLFQDGGKFLPFVEVTNPDRTPNQVAIDEGVTEYPTWEFPDGTRLTGVQSLQTLSQRAVVPIPQSSTPSIAPIGNVTVGIGSPLNIPIDGYDPNGNPLTITVTSSNPGSIATGAHRQS